MKSRIESVRKVYKKIASLAGLNVDELERESLKVYLEQRLRYLEVEKFSIVQKYGISNVEEMEEMYKEKKLSERESWEDYFELDHIEAEIEEIKQAQSVL